MAYTSTISLIAPETLKNKAENLALCFESCPPSCEMLPLNYSLGGVLYGVCSSACRPEWIDSILELLDAGTVTAPAWNNGHIDIALANDALADIILYSPGMPLPGDKIVLAIDEQLQSVLASLGLQDR